MKLKLLMLLFTLFQLELDGAAQGTVLFTNLGGGVFAPISVDGNALGRNDAYYAELYVDDGVRVAGPSSFLANGYFYYGEVMIPDSPPGSVVKLVLRITRDDEVVWESDRLPIVLGDEEPAHLAGLDPVNIDSGQPQSIYQWAVFGADFGSIGPLTCVSTGVLGFVPLDTKACEGIPVPGRFRTLHVERTRDGLLEIMWPQNLDLVLFGSADLVEPKWRPVPTKGVNGRGAFFVQIDPSDGMGIFRLGEAPTNQE